MLLSLMLVKRSIPIQLNKTETYGLSRNAVATMKQRRSDRKSAKSKLESGSCKRKRLDGARREPFDPPVKKSY